MTAVSKWLPGNLYQPGALVQPNELSGVTQTAPANADFESGDVSWTKETGWTIDNVDAFAGSWSGKFAGEAGPRVLLLGSRIFTRSTITTDGITCTESAESLANVGGLAGNSSIAVAAGLGTLKTSTNGLNWTVQANPTNWTSAKGWAHWSDTLGKFMVVDLNGTRYFLSANGIDWTEYTFAESFNNTEPDEMPAENGDTLVLLTVTGNIYSSTDGVTWTERSTAFDSSTGSVVYAASLGKFFAAGTISGSVEVYSSADGITWTDETTNNLNAMSVGSEIAWSPDESVFVARGATVAGTPDVATSPDGVTWTLHANAGLPGDELTYSNILQQFLSRYTNVLNLSSDGVSWSSVTCLGGPIGRASDFPLPDPPVSIVNDTKAAVAVGQTIRARALFKLAATGEGYVGLRWYTSGDVEIQTDHAEVVDRVAGATAGWKESSAEAKAPATAAKVSVVGTAASGGEVRVDNAVLEHFNVAASLRLVFEATQAAAGRSDTSEPTWPTVVGNTVVDNEVTWTARAANIVEWEAKAILKSGATEPVWPLEIDAVVADNTILWKGDDQRVQDTNCPNTKEVAILASKIFAADDDIIPFSATVNPLDWTSANDAGFIPFGLNTYGSEPVSALGIYRSNLVAFNSKAFQMWQVDEDPANFAILDAVPVDCSYYRSLSPVSNDLVFLSSEGIRSMGIAGGSTNLQAGFFGKQIDPLVKAALAGMSDVEDIISLFWPGAGQYWLIFDNEAFVLTMNGGKQDMSWSRYAFPSNIDAVTLKDTELHLRSGNKVWKVDEDTLRDDEGGDNVQFVGRIWWPYLDFGALGVTKSMIGFDVVADGTFTVSFGYSQKDDTQFTTPYSIDGDTLTGDIIPIPISAPSFQLRLEFAGNEAWEWSAAALHLQDWRTTS